LTVLLTKSYAGRAQRLQEACDLQALYNSYQKSQYWELIESPPENLSIHIVRAANSDR